ncbi:MAG TPA: Stp1/IreP family PP2C-type Ser/Thr phosphatase [Clostridia bacterium]|nr:Stp1/IreP family PP2C-type Ser/Thr phosphatase [Clostridia bacterium]
MKIVAKTDIGVVRDSNQDCYSIGELPGGVAWAVVCDGMGGALGGDVASSTAVKMISEKIASCYHDGMSSNSIKNILVSAIESTNTCLYDMSVANDSLAGMGTTVVAAIVTNDLACIAHAGDSRAYKVSSEAIIQLTKDHSVVQALVENGQITQDEAKVHPRKNIITRALGVDESIEIDFCEEPITDNDTILICTDGLTNYLETDEIYAIARSVDHYQFAEELVKIANSKGGGDNITVVAIAH